MKSLVLLLAIVGQCSGGYCPTPSPSYLPSFQPAPYRVQQVEVAPYYVVAPYSIRHEGLTFSVYGYFKDGSIVWEREDPRNVASWSAAKAKAGSGAAVKAVPLVRPVPSKNAGSVATVTNYGLEPARMKHESTYTVSGPKAKHFVESSGDKEVSHSGALHVTVIGQDADRAVVINDLKSHPAFNGIKQDLMVQGYSTGEWAVDKSLGFVDSGKPTIIVQSAKSASDPKGGKVVFRASDYSMGPEAFAEELRKVDPHYKPSIDPGPANGRQSSLCPLGFTRDSWPLIVCVAIGIFWIYSLPKKGG